MKFRVTDEGDIVAPDGRTHIMWPEWGRWFDKYRRRNDGYVWFVEFSQVHLYDHDLKLVKTQAVDMGHPVSPVWVHVGGIVPLAFRLCEQETEARFPNVTVLYARLREERVEDETSLGGGKG